MNNIELAQAELIKRRAAEDLLFFINYCCKTFDPRTPRKNLPFKLYPYQEEYALSLKAHIEEQKDFFVEKSRDMGVSWVTLAVFLWFWLFKDGFECLLGSRKEDYVDDGTMKSLFPKIDYMIEHLPFQVEGYNPKKCRTFLKLINPRNGSVISGESANENFSRAGRFNVVFFDEFAFWPFAEPAWGAAGDATPCRIAVTTPSAEPHYAKALRFSGLVEVKTLHWKLHPLKTEEWYENEKTRRTSEEVARELDINWEGSLTGLVYPEIKHGEFGEFPFMLNAPIYVSWDFGLDGTAVQWWQQNPENGKYRLIESYYNNNKVIEYFFPFFGHPVSSAHVYRPEDLSLIEKMSSLPKATHFGDPDVAKRSYQTGTSTRDALELAGIYVQTNPKSNDLESRKTETKRILQNGIEINNTPNNNFWFECMKNARYPRREDTSQSVTPILRPIHDWTSHHRTSTEYFSVNVAEQSDFIDKRFAQFNATQAEISWT